MHNWRCSGVVAAVLGLFIALGCQPARRYDPAPGTPTTPRATATFKATRPRDLPAKPATAPLSPEIAWMEPTPSALLPPVPILFVHESNQPEEWERLPRFWNVVQGEPSPAKAVAIFGGGPWVAVSLGASGVGQPVVKIKVPLGLDDPTPFIPPANPPTLAKWELGKRLFFDNSLLHGAKGVKACASCHQPATGFTNPKEFLPRNPPTLINAVYNSHQFWDGRVTALEEVIQRTLDDERETAGARPEDRHVWPGVVEQLRGNPDYVAKFKQAFGTPPTQDAIGKALATYMRTILSGNSLHDQAMRRVQQRGAKTLEAADYERLLDEKTIKFLLEGLDDPRPKAEVAEQLLTGFALYSGKAGCVVCHSGRQYTDNSFHNLGEGDSRVTPAPGQETGRFAHLPPGLKDRRMIGAYKTPTLRALPRTGPYFRDGLREHLFEVIQVHVKPRPSPFLDPEIRDRGLTEGEKRALVVFLRALDGEAIAPEVAQQGK
jgi:cytochrome c peroxidase